MTPPPPASAPNSGGKRRALFLDRDGVINVDRGYVCRPGEFEFVEGIFELCRQAAEQGYRLIVVTNQAGIGRGYYTERQFHELTGWMRQQFLARGICIDRVYFCPFHPEHGLGGYRRESDCRKPKPGMILQAVRECGLDPASSILIGDKESDIEAGEAAGVGLNLLYRPGVEGPAASANGVVVGSLAEAAQCLVDWTAKQ